MAKSKSAGTRGARKKRSGGEDMTGKSEGAVEVRTAMKDDAPELVLPKPDDYAFHKKTIIGYREQMDSARGRYRDALKSAQKAGIDTEALLEADKLRRGNDHAKMQRHFTQLAFALAQEGYPIKLSVTDTLREDSDEIAYKRGFAAGKAGETLNNPYPVGTSLAAQYTRGWHHGTGANMNPPLTPEQVDAALAEDQDADGATGTADDGKQWPDDEQAAAHGASPQIDGKAWDENADKVVNGDDAGELPAALDRRRQPELTH